MEEVGVGVKERRQEQWPLSMAEECSKQTSLTSKEWRLGLGKLKNEPRVYGMSARLGGGELSGMAAWSVGPLRRV